MLFGVFVFIRCRVWEGRIWVVCLVFCSGSIRVLMGLEVLGRDGFFRRSVCLAGWGCSFWGFLFFGGGRGYI